MKRIARRTTVQIVVSLAVLSAVYFHMPTRSASGQGRTSPRPRQAKAPPGNVDLSRSRVYIHVDKTGLGHEHAVEGVLKYGNIEQNGRSGMGRLVFDMGKFDADTPAARRYIGLKGDTDASTRRDVNANMLGTAVLNVKQFPTATFAISEITLLKEKSRHGHAQYRFRGDFTLHGTKHPIEFVAEKTEISGATRFQGGFKIRQTAFGITPFSKAFGAVGVKDELTIYGDIRVTTKRPADRTAIRTGRRQ